MMKQVSRLLLAGLAASGLTALAAETGVANLPPPANQTGVTYDKDIKPIFQASCFGCHGAERPRNNLRLDSLDGVLKGSRDGKVIVPGDSANSKLVLAVARVNPRTAMPPSPGPQRRGAPGGTNAPPANPTPGSERRGPTRPPSKPLTSEQVALIRAWVDQGAK